MTNTQSPAPGVAAEVDRLMSLAREMALAEVDAHFLCPYEGEKPTPEYEAADAKYVLARDNLKAALRAALQASAAAVPVFLVHSGLLNGGEALYTRHDVCPPLCDAEKLYTAPPLPAQVQAAEELQSLREADEMLKEIGSMCRDQTMFVGSYAEIVRQALASRTPAPGMAAEPDYKALNQQVAELIFANDREGARTWAKGLLYSEGVVSVEPGMAGGVGALTPDQLADKCEAWIQAGGASNIVDAYEAGYRESERAAIEAGRAGS